MWAPSVLASLLALAVAGSARAYDDLPVPPRERSPVAPCRPSPGELVPGPCSPDPDAPRDPSQAGRPPDTSDPGAPAMPMDRPHARVEESLTSVVQRLDDFFGDPTHIHLNPPSARVRLRSGVRAEQGDLFQPEGSVVADVRLPSLDALLSRARLFIAGGGEEDPARTGTEQDLVPRRFGPSVRGGHGAVELRFDLYREGLTLVDFGTGVRFGLPPPPYVRARVARAFELRLGIVAHGNQTVFWERRDGFGESTRLDVERVFGPITIARLWGIATIDEVSRGLEWSGEAGLQQGLGRRTGVYLAGGIDGATRPAPRVDRYRVFTRLRRDVRNAWLFVELEPEVAWKLDDPGLRRSRVFATTVRLEVQFLTRQP